jgi:tetratricopeptide (TPR) repeat protein
MRAPKPRRALLGPMTVYVPITSFAWIALLAALMLPLLAIAADETSTAADQAPSAAIDLEALQKDRQQKAGRYPIAQRISRYLAAAAKDVDEGKPQEAKDLLKKLDPKRLNPYERALVYRMLAHIAYGANEPEEAIGYFVQFLGEEMLPIRDEARVRFNIAQIYASLQQWRKTIDWINRWLLYVENPDPLGFYLMGIAHFQLEEFDAGVTTKINRNRTAFDRFVHRNRNGAHQEF